MAENETPAAPQQKEKKKAVKFRDLRTLGSTRELVNDLFAPDAATRRMARYFVLSVVGVVAVLVLGAVYFTDLRKPLSEISATGEQGKNLGEFIAKQAQEAKRKFSTQSLGSFTIQLKTPEGVDPNAPRQPGVMNLAQVEIIVECDDKQTCDFIEDRMTAIRDQVTSLFTPMDRDELLSREGKHRLKMRIISKLNLWLPKGKVQNLYFNKLVIS